MQGPPFLFQMRSMPGSALLIELHCRQIELVPTSVVFVKDVGLKKLSSLKVVFFSC